MADSGSCTPGWRCVGHWLAAIMVLLPAATAAQAPLPPPRVFPEFVGSWVLDDSAGAGRIAAPPVARTVAIAITPTETPEPLNVNPRTLRRTP